ncbi:MAG: hypothetical protein ACXQTG_02270 [Methanoculleaceae archaeon]
MHLIPVRDGYLECTDGRRIPVERCRFCIHSVRFRVAGDWVDSPARAYCLLCRTGEEIDPARVEAVECDDRKVEGFSSMLNVIA